jgi:hypothetical protein
MKTEQIKVATEIQSNIEIGSILVREIDITYKYRVVKAFFISIKLSKPPPTMSATASLNCVQPSP